MRSDHPLRRLADRIDARERRERVLLALTLAVVVLVLWSVLVRAPLAERRANAVAEAERIRGDLASLRDSRSAIAEQVRELEAERGESPAERLRRRIEAVDDVLAERTARLISPEQMVAALRDVVNADAGVSLVRLRNRGANPVITEERGGDGQAAEADGGGRPADVPRVYRHEVELVVEGRYLELLGYLQRLEGLEWQFQWNAIALETREYPLARARISLSTLSLAEDWVGV